MINRCLALYYEFRGAKAEKLNFGDLFELDCQLALKLSANPIVLDLLESLMGPFVQLDGLTLANLPPAREGAYPEVLGWHRDPWGQVPRSNVFERPLAVNALYYLQDLTPDVGPLRTLPASPHLPLTLAPALHKVRLPGEFLLYPKAGDIVLHHNNLIHSGTPPTNPTRNRNFVSIFYNLSWLRQSVRFDGPEARALILGFRANNNYRLLRLMGIDDHISERSDTGFLAPDGDAWTKWIRADKQVRKTQKSSTLVSTRKRNADG